MAPEPVRISPTAVSPDAERAPGALEDGRALLRRTRLESPTPELRRAIAARLRQIAKMRTREAADLLCDFIAEPQLAAWRDAGGPSLRTRATQALLSMGYPFALLVSPDALEQARKETAGPGPGTRTAAWVLAALAAALTLVMPLTAFFIPRTEIGLLLGLILATAFLAGREDGKTVWLGVPLLGILGIIELATAGTYLLRLTSWPAAWLGCEVLAFAGTAAVASAGLFLAARKPGKPVPGDSP